VRKLKNEECDSALFRCAYSQAGVPENAPCLEFDLYVHEFMQRIWAYANADLCELCVICAQ
jgi:hypothetical protein